MTKQGKASVSEETFAEFLASQGMLESCEDHAMAARMKTSRRQLDRLLDPAVPSVTLDILRRAASAVGRTLRIELV